MYTVLIGRININHITGIHLTVCRIYLTKQGMENYKKKT